MTRDDTFVNIPYSEFLRLNRLEGLLYDATKALETSNELVARMMQENAESTSTPATWDPADVYRARGMGIDLT